VDAVSLIFRAPAGGTAPGVTEVTSSAGRDAYEELRRLMQRRFTDNRRAEAALDGHANDPGAWEQPLCRCLAKWGAANDEEVLQSAQRLMALWDPGVKKADTHSADMRLCDYSKLVTAISCTSDPMGVMHDGNEIQYGILSQARV